MGHVQIQQIIQVLCCKETNLITTSKLTTTTDLFALYYNNRSIPHSFNAVNKNSN